MPIIGALNNKHLQEEDLRKIKVIIGDDSIDFKTVELKDLLKKEIFKFKDDIVKLAKQVEEESKLGIMFEEVVKAYADIEIKLEPLRQDQKDSVFILSEIDSLVQRLENIWGKINVIFGSRYLEALKGPVNKKREEISKMIKLIDEWIKFQDQYVYLETIFSNPDFKKEFTETGNWDFCNQRYRKTAKDFSLKGQGAKAPGWIETCLKAFKEINEKMSAINQSINEFLDKKRNELYRLHFISNDEMIVLLAKADQIDVVQQYIGKLFENVNRLNFGEKDKEFMFDGVISREGEVLLFYEFLSVKGEAPKYVPSYLSIKEKSIGNWLPEMEKLIRETLSRQVTYALLDMVESEIREEFYRKHSAQPISIVNQLFWTFNTNQNIADSNENPEALWNWYKEIVTNIELLTSIVRSGLDSKRHTIICSVVTSEVHNRDVIYDLYEKGVVSVKDFAWEQQLRYEPADEKWKDPSSQTTSNTNNVTIRQISASFQVQL